MFVRVLRFGSGLQEVELLSRLQHPNIVQYLGTSRVGMLPTLWAECRYLGL